MAGESYDLDFDHQFIETEKYDAKMTYKKFTGYSPGVAVIGDLIVGIRLSTQTKIVRKVYFRTIYSLNYSPLTMRMVYDNI